MNPFKRKSTTEDVEQAIQGKTVKTPIWTRPFQYIRSRRNTEQWIQEELDSCETIHFP